MKKIVLSSLIALLSIIMVQAQSKPSFGFKAGLNFVEFDAENDSSIDGSTGFHVGAVVSVPLVKKYGIQAEVLYSIENIKDVVDVAYVNVPILATYKLIPGLRVQLGPQFKVKANSDLENEGLSSVEDDLSSFNFDAALGVEYKFPAIGIFAQARYNYGITDIVKDGDLTANTFQLSVGYRF